MTDDPRAERIKELIGPLRVEPGSRVDLPHDFDPAYKVKGLKKAEGAGLLRAGIAMLAEYQDRLAAQDTYGVLVCLQALDAAGKDGTIRHVMSGVNPQGVQVHSFKVPSATELDHDYLWRYAQRLPARGDIAIFNRSHYEEVLVVRVHPENLDRQKLPADCKGKDIWERRYREINNWERYLSDNGFKIIKIFLNLSREEQRARFLKRIDLPEKNWKFSAADARERERWTDYQQAFSHMLSATSTPWAPWHVIPADRKWFARICAAAVLINTLIEIDPRYPQVNEETRRQLLEVKEELEAQAPKGAAADPFAAGQSPLFVLSELISIVATYGDPSGSTRLARCRRPGACYRRTACRGGPRVALSGAGAKTVPGTSHGCCSADGGRSSSARGGNSSATRCECESARSRTWRCRYS